MQRGPVGVGEDRDRRQPALLARPDHADGDFTAVGYEDFFEHDRNLETNS